MSSLEPVHTREGPGVSVIVPVRDDPALLEKAFAEAGSIADVVITSGGVSVGEADFVKAMLDKLGEVVFWKIAMKPGRPLAYGKVGSAHFFGLPGNPVAVTPPMRIWPVCCSSLAATRRPRRSRVSPGSARRDCDSLQRWRTRRHRALGRPAKDDVVVSTRSITSLLTRRRRQNPRRHPN